MAKPRAYSRLSPAQRGAITRRARAEGKDPSRVHAALKGLETRARNKRRAAREARAYTKAVKHGKAARERTERDISTTTFQQRAQRARHVAERATRHRGPLSTLRQLDSYDFSPDDYDIDIEGHHEQDADTGEVSD